MRVLVCTVVHHPSDARIYHRQIRALLDAGHEVTYIAPHELAPLASLAPPGADGPPAPSSGAGGPSATGAMAPMGRSPQLVAIPRASGRRRLGALLAARRAMARYAPSADILLVHDPELLLVLPRRRPPTVWDVHEDTAAALTTKAWLPRFLRPLAAGGVIAAERLAERRMHLLLAETGYQARFRRQHPVVPNTAYVPETLPPASPPPRVVYVGHLSPDRGVPEMIELGRMLWLSGIAVELAGPADPQARVLLEAAQDALTWHGFVPNDEAMRLVDGALAGLSLLRDEANFRVSMPTKVVEYMAHGVPVITTPLPLAVELVESAGAGFVVGFGDAAGARDAVLRLAADPGLRAKMGANGHEAALRDHAWPAHARAFVAQLENWAR